MLRGGSFDQSGGCQELHEEWRMRRLAELSSDDRLRRNPQTSAQLPGIDPGPHNGGA